MFVFWHALKRTGLYVKYRLTLFLWCNKPENKQQITAIFLNNRCFFYFHKYFFHKKTKKRLNDIIGHGLLWFINVQYQNIYCIYKLYRMLLATKTDFYLFLKKCTKIRVSEVIGFGIQKWKFMNWKPNQGWWPYI